MPPLLDLGAHCRFEEPVCAAPFDLGPVKRGVGMAHQALAVEGVVGIDCDADARRNQAAIGRLLVCGAERIDDAFGDASDRRRVVQAGRDDGEFVAAEPRQHLTVVEDDAGATGDRLQQRVAGGVPEKIVDLLEAVEVEAEQRQAAAGRRGHRYLPVEPAVEAAAVGQAGQRIVLGEVVQIGFRLFAGAHVAHRDRLTRQTGKTYRTPDEFDRDHPPVGVAQHGFDQLAGTAEQLGPHRFFGQERRQKGAGDVFLGDPGQAGKAPVAVAIVSPSQTSRPSTAALARPRMRSVSCSSRRRSRMSRASPQQARSRIARLASATATASQPVGRAVSGTVILRSGMIEAAPIAVKWWLQMAAVSSSAP